MLTIVKLTILAPKYAHTSSLPIGLPMASFSVALLPHAEVSLALRLLLRPRPVHARLSPVNCKLCLAEVRSLLPKCYLRVGGAPGRLRLRRGGGIYTGAAGPRAFAAAVRATLANVTTAAAAPGRLGVGAGSTASGGATVFELDFDGEDLDYTSEELNFAYEKFDSTDVGLNFT